MSKKIKLLLSCSKKSVQFIWCNDRQYFFLIIISIVLNAVRVFPGMYLTSYSIDLLTRQVDFSDYISVVLFVLLTMLTLSIVSQTVNNRLAYVKKRLDAKISMKIDEVCLQADYADIQSKSFTDQKNFALAAVNNGSLDLVIQCLKSLLSSILTMSAVLWIISTSSFLILIPLAVSLLISIYHDYLNARHNFIDTKEQTEYWKKTSYLQKISTDFHYAKEIRMFHLTDSFQGCMDEVELLLYRSRENRRKKRLLPGLLIYSSETILDAAIYLYFGFQVLVTASITLGQFSLYANALRQLKNSVNDILYVTTEFYVNMDYLDSLFSFIEMKHFTANCAVSARDSLHSSLIRRAANSGESDLERMKLPAASCEELNPKRLKRKQPAGNGTKLSASQAQIRFENVSFRYPFADRDALKNINITIHAGETLLVVGENGAGKSTFIKLLCGFYQPTCGKIYLNETDITDLEPSQYRGLISAVFQDFSLFAMSIAENVCAMQEKKEEKLRQALEQVNLAEVINGTLHQSDTALYRIFDEDGVEFSGGEMQKLAIARAIYKDAPILILDEPASALDPKAEYEIYNNFQKMARGRTAVYISHRLSGTKFSDKIAVFDAGEIVEYGTHESLMQKKGLYAELYSLQASLYAQELSLRTIPGVRGEAALQ